MKIMRVFSLIMVVIMVNSCSFSTWVGKKYKVGIPPTQIQTPNFKENIYEKTKELNSSSKNLDLNNDDLKIIGKRLKTEKDPKEIIKLSSKVDSIVKSNINNIKNIEKSIKPLIDIAYQLNYLKDYIKDIEIQNNKILEENTNLRETIAKLEDKVYKLRSDEQKWYNKLWIGIACLGALSIVLGIFMVKSMPKMGISHIGGGIMIISLAYFAQQYVWVVALFGGIFLIGSVGILIYMLFIHKKAISENAHATEKLKNNDWENVKEEFNKIHSNATKKLFSEEKSKLKHKGVL